MLLLTNRTLKRAVIDRDAVWIGHLWLAWVIWGHVVTLTRLTDADPFSSSPTVPRASPVAGDSSAARD